MFIRKQSISLLSVFGKNDQLFNSGLKIRMFLHRAKKKCEHKKQQTLHNKCFLIFIIISLRVHFLFMLTETTSLSTSLHDENK